jgi:hypothetical protein
MILPAPETLLTNPAGTTRAHIHFNNCTWCIHRKVYKKAVDKKYEKETCDLTNILLAPPTISDSRYCEHYVQEHCTCPACTIIGLVTNHLVNILDIGEQSC